MIAIVKVLSAALVEKDTHGSMNGIPMSMLE